MTLLVEKWYVVVNDLIGGYDISTVDAPASEQNPHEKAEVAWGISKEVADYIVEMHNARLLLRCETCDIPLLRCEVGVYHYATDSEEVWCMKLG